MEAARSSFSRPSPLPLEAAGSSDPSHDGRHKLPGAFLIELRRIRPDESQPRRIRNELAQRELTDSVKRLGIIQPITVRYVPGQDIYRIINGERRFEAAKAAGLPEIPCWAQTPKSEEILLRQLVENWQRADLHPFDLADALLQLREAGGYSQKVLAQVTGKSEVEISKLFSLLKLSPAAQQMARADSTGMLTKRHLLEIVKLPSADQQAFLQLVADQRLTVAETEQAVAKRRADASGTKRRGPPLTVKRYMTRNATVTFTFRRRSISTQDMLDTLAEVRGQIDGQDEQAGNTGSVART